MAALRSSYKNHFSFSLADITSRFCTPLICLTAAFPVTVHADGGQEQAQENVQIQESSADTFEESQPRQYLSTQLHYLVPDSDRDIARNGVGMGVQYGRQWTSHLWWETELAGYNLESGVNGSTDFYQAGLTTGLLYAFGDRKAHAY